MDSGREELEPGMTETLIELKLWHDRFSFFAGQFFIDKKHIDPEVQAQFLGMKYRLQNGGIRDGRWHVQGLVGAHKGFPDQLDIFEIFSDSKYEDPNSYKKVTYRWKGSVPHGELLHGDTPCVAFDTSGEVTSPRADSVLQFPDHAVRERIREWPLLLENGMSTMREFLARQEQRLHDHCRESILSRFIAENYSVHVLKVIEALQELEKYIGNAGFYFGGVAVFAKRNLEYVRQELVKIQAGVDKFPYLIGGNFETHLRMCIELIETIMHTAFDRLASRNRFEQRVERTLASSSEEPSPDRETMDFLLRLLRAALDRKSSGKKSPSDLFVDDGYCNELVKIAMPGLTDEFRNKRRAAGDGDTEQGVYR